MDRRISSPFRLLQLVHPFRHPRTCSVRLGSARLKPPATTRTDLMARIPRTPIWQTKRKDDSKTTVRALRLSGIRTTLSLGKLKGLAVFRMRVRDPLQPLQMEPCRKGASRPSLLVVQLYGPRTLTYIYIYTYIYIIHICGESITNMQLHRLVLFAIICIIHKIALLFFIAWHCIVYVFCTCHILVMSHVSSLQIHSIRIWSPPFAFLERLGP